MFADQIQLVAVVLAAMWAVAVLRHCCGSAGRPSWSDMRVLLIGGAATALLLAQATLADHLVDAGNGPIGLDRDAWALAAAHRTPGLTLVAAILRVAGGTVALTTLAACVAAVLAARRRHLDALLVAAAPFVSTVVISIVKPSYGRPRPPAAEQLIPEAGFSLPSGHTLDATVVVGVIAVVAAVRLRHSLNRRAAVATAAVVIASAGGARIYLGVHWATDVIAGWLLGSVFVALAAAVLLTENRQRRATRPPADLGRAGRRPLRRHQLLHPPRQLAETTA